LENNFSTKFAKYGEKINKNTLLEIMSFLEIEFSAHFFWENELEKN
jgi:hypothetical protein